MQVADEPVAAVAKLERACPLLKYHIGCYPRLFQALINLNKVPEHSRRREFCHSAGIPSPSVLKHLLKGEGGAAEGQNSRRRPRSRTRSKRWTGMSGGWWRPGLEVCS